MTAPEKIVVHFQRWVDSNTGEFVSYSFEGEFRDADIYTTQDDVSYTRSDLYEAAQDRIKALESELALAKIASEPVYSRRQLEAENAELRAQVAKLIQERDLNHKQILSLQERLPPLREIRPIGGDYRRG